MGLKMMKDKGIVRRAWYGQYMEQGKWKVIRLTTPMRGAAPASLKEHGDEAFEKSRALAQAEFDAFEQTRSVKGHAETIQIAIVESKTGRKCEYVRLDELPELWKSLSRSYTPTENSITSAERYFRRFAEHARCTYLYEVTPQMAASFFNGIRSQFSWSTVKDTMSVLKSAFARFLPVGMVNPFASVIKRSRELNTAKVHRRPLSETELAALFDEARKDKMLYALAVTAACTGMRIGDVCNLEWASVDLRGGFIDVITAKAGQPVTIPIFDTLREVLETALAERDGDYVFPDAASMYQYNPSGIIRRGKGLFARALFRDEAERKANEVDAERVEKTPAEVVEAIRNAGWTEQKTERCVNVYNLYITGKSYREIERETGLSRGQICDYLHGIEDAANVTIVKWSKVCATSNRKLIGETRKERKVGVRSASLFGWHSLRASFVVTALMHGVPVEVVRMIVGHSTVAMTQEYFNPTKNIIAETMKRKMHGSVLTDGRTRTDAPTALPLPVTQSTDADAPQSELAALAAKLAKLSPAEREALRAMLV